MKLYFSIIALIGCVNFFYAQTNPKSNNETVIADTIIDEPFTVVEQMPAFPGGPDSMYKFLAKNIQYPQYEREHNIQGKVFVQFIVDKTGKTRNPKILRGVIGGDGLSKEAIRVVSIMPDWKPGMQNGKTVNVFFNLPISFKLTDPQKK